MNDLHKDDTEAQTEDIPGPDAPLQTIFDFVVGKLRAQGCKSIGTIPDSGYGESCLYRGGNGTKCAGGWLISNDACHPSFENKAVRNLAYFDAWGFDRIELIASLQATHDHCDVADWETDWRARARRFNLVYTPPTPTP